MKVNVLGQINIQGVEMNVYQFPNTSLMSDNAYFGHLEIFPFLVRHGYINISNVDDLDGMFDKIPLEDIVDFPSSKCPDTRHCFIRVERFGEMIGTPIFEQPNWRETYIHPISLDL